MIFSGFAFSDRLLAQQAEAKAKVREAENAYQTAKSIVAQRESEHAAAQATLEQAFIMYLQQAGGVDPQSTEVGLANLPRASRTSTHSGQNNRGLSLLRLLSISRREAIELRRDPVRAAIALLGSLILMLTFGYGITMDVENLRFAVLDRDQTTLSNNYALDLGGSRYFTTRPPIADYTELDRRMRSGELSLALEIPPHFARDPQRGEPVKIGG